MGKKVGKRSVWLEFSSKMKPERYIKPDRPLKAFGFYFKNIEGPVKYYQEKR